MEEMMKELLAGKETQTERKHFDMFSASCEEQAKFLEEGADKVLSQVAMIGMAEMLIKIHGVKCDAMKKIVDGVKDMDSARNPLGNLSSLLGDSKC